MAGGGTTLLKLAQKVDGIAASLENEEQRIGADIVRKALSYPLKLIANNAGVNGSVVVQKVGACKPALSAPFDFLEPLSRSGVQGAAGHLSYHPSTRTHP